MLETLKTTDFDALRLKLASPEDIKNWSHGEVTKPETINYRTQKPEKDGLFCERIFGPSKDWECYCGKYKKIRYKGIICDKCGVEVTRAIVRRERMGHINLAIPVSHIWYLRGVPSKIGLILDMSIQNLEKVIYFANFIITDIDENAKTQSLEQLKKEYKQKRKAIVSQFEQEAENLKKTEKNEEIAETALIALNENRDKEIASLDEDYKSTEKEIKDLKALKIISEGDYRDLSLKYGYMFNASIGAEAIRKLLTRVNVSALIDALEQEKEDAVGTKKRKIIQRVRLLRSMVKNNISPEWMILTALPVIPPDLRPMVPLDGGRFATSDLNDLYRRVINRNNRLKRLQELNAPEVICRNEKRMLQEAVDALIDNSARHTKTTTASTGQKRQLKSLADILKGKQGRFRQNLLGKRIDYSGRSVIVVGPNLLIYQCGLPKRMALELFKPFIISKLINREFVHNIRSANRFIESNRPEIWDILEEIIKDAHVLLNRAPTLHRLGIQAFKPVLIEGKAIQLHPLVCTAFNADFDGDQMAVHVPLTDEAREEAAQKMLSAKNLLKPATGKPIANPDKDMSWGCYYITACKDRADSRKKIFCNIAEAKTAYALENIKINEKIMIKLRLKPQDEAEQVIETSLGRVLFNEVLPDKLPFYNEQIDKKRISDIIATILSLYSFEETAVVLDKIKSLGYKYATKSGYSWGMDDLPELKEKKGLIEQGDKEVDEVISQYEMGFLTKDEKHSKIIEIWTKIKDKVTQLSKTSLDPESSVASMIMSGSRGSWGQLTQMVGMKGPVSNPSGDIIELPVKANFKEGLQILEYFISTHGTRKGLSDTALRTANAGYLTRRLVDVAQEVVVEEDDCHDKEGFIMREQDTQEMGETMLNRIMGRYVLQDIKDEKGNVLVHKGSLIDEEAAVKLQSVHIGDVKIRSPLSCKIHKGICKKCYGLDLSYNKAVETGSAVGIIAAQSIGEPGTQLTMRTFHTGGVAGSDITQGLPRVEELFEARPPKRKAVMAEHEGLVNIVEESRTHTDESGRILVNSAYGQKTIKLHYRDEDSDKYKLKPEFTIKVKDGATVSKGDILIIDDKGAKVKARNGGKVKLEKKRLLVNMEIDKEDEYIVPPGYVLWVKDGDLVAQGDQLTEGALDLQQLFKLRGKEAVQNYLIKEVQQIYSSQGQKLNDKHLEVIIRQLFSRVYIKDAGQTDLLPGEIVEKSEILHANELAETEGKAPALYDELFLGVSKVSLSTTSFLSAASFQETSKVLINASLSGKIDHLEGLKENVIIGRLIPAGTGFRKKGIAEDK